MNKLFKKIYQEVLVYEEDIVKGNHQVDKLLNDLTEPYKEQSTDDELEKLKELLSIMALTAEQTGFENGVKFTLKMLFFIVK